jgi:hypothetical protein
MEPSSNTKWCQITCFVIPNDANLVITWSRNAHVKTPIPGKPSKSGLIGVWHKDNLYLGTSTIGNEKPPPNKNWFANEKYKDDAMKTVVLRLVIFQFFREPWKGDYLTNTHTHTHTHKVRQTRSFINLNYLTYMSGYAFIYTLDLNKP